MRARAGSPLVTNGRSGSDRGAEAMPALAAEQLARAALLELWQHDTSSHDGTSSHLGSWLAKERSASVATPAAQVPEAGVMPSSSSALLGTSSPASNLAMPAAFFPLGTPCERGIPGFKGGKNASGSHPF